MPQPQNVRWKNNMKRFKEILEQHLEKGRFKPVKPHNVPNIAVASPRSSSDSASVKLKEDLRKWFSKTDPAGDWKRINSKGEAIGPCAREPGEPKPKCMSAEKRASLTKKERASAVRAKRKHDPNPERKGEPINVSNFGKGKISESMKNLNEKNVPTSPEKWAQAKSQAKAKFDVYPSAYANGWAAKKYKAMGGSWKSVSEAKEKTEYDYEGDMARGQLQSIISNAQRVHDMLKDDTNIAEWVQSKITLAEDYISTVANYMMSELDEAKEVGDDPTGGEPEPNLSVKKGKTVITNPVTEATSARARLADAMKKAQEQREREERAGAALLKPKPKNEEVMIEREDDEYHTPSKHHVQVQVSKGDGQKTYRKATVRAKEPKHAVSAAIAHYKQQGYTVHDHKYLGEDVEQIEEGRASQRHPLEGHEYHKKSDEALVHIAKDAHAAAEAMKSHNTTAENKYRDQANDSATVRHYRKTHGMADWYKKKYGHVEESFKPMDEPNYKNSIQARQAAADKSSTALSGLVAKKNLKQAEGKNKSQEFINKMTSKVNAGKRLGEAQNDPPFDKPYTTKPSTVTDKSGAKHSPMSRARDIARTAAKKQSEFLKARNAGSNTKNARARAAGANNPQMFESRQAEIVREAMKVAKEKKKKGNSEDKFIADPELNSRVIKTAAQM
jgi:hypothetical protein